MKQVLTILAIVAVVGSAVGMGYYFYKNNDEPTEKYATVKPEMSDVFKKTVATGSIMPKKEITIKPQVSGILDKLYIEPGQKVKKGQLLAKIQVIPDMSSLSNAESQLRRAKITLENADKELKRQQRLYEQGVISSQEFQTFKREFDLAKENVESGKENLKIIKEGTASDAGASTTLVRSTVDGMVLDTPFKEGSQVIMSNNFNEGSTIATIADMGEMIFEGKVDESEVGKLQKGMPLKLKVGAIDGVEFNANLNYISPKGITEEGAIKFDVKANVALIDSVFLRAGYSANADIVLDKRLNVLTVEESNVTFNNDSTFVEVKIGEDKFEKRLLKTGLSDGINIEVLSGITKDDEIKKL
ncbi:efflux RND transporter periplasmic adaptor subunit [Limibacter armeniacum]|uniref:efflux RND transporter periplasmic adaptor subunit n=1 Tax=Limibacter armeniacum TaxID=466084 RepID=UPI002FE5DC03